MRGVITSRVEDFARRQGKQEITAELLDNIMSGRYAPALEAAFGSGRLRRRFGRPACLRERVHTSGRRWDQRGAWRTIVLMWRLRWRYW